MLSEERRILICDYVNRESAVTVQELMAFFDASEATIRRDLTELNRKGLLVKVHGGAVALQAHIITDDKVSERETVNREEKITIARYAAGLIREHELVYLDAGTTTALVIEYLDANTCRDVLFVTNAIEHARRLSDGGYRVYLTGGRLKSATEALVGTECFEMLQKYHFSIGFFGTNAVNKRDGFTTPDPEEAKIKETARIHCHIAYALCDHDKFDKTSSVQFSEFSDMQIVTTQGIPDKYKKESNILIL